MTWTPPEISDRHPYPPTQKPVRKRGTQRPPSPWRKFLTGLKPRQSFVVEWYSLQTVKVNAQIEGVKIAWAENEPRKNAQGLALARVWRLA